MLRILGLILLGGLISPSTSYGQFEGGTISFSVRNDSSGKLMADLDVLTGWVLQKGPCGNQCSKADIGKNTNAGRAKTKANFGDTRYFGNWTSKYHTSGMTEFRDITSDIDSNLTEILLRMDTSIGWEQDQMKVSVELEASNNEDIHFDGYEWHPLTMQRQDMVWHLQAKVDSRLRNDTGYPNRSPIALMRPVYRVRLNKINEIHLATTDPDNDLTKCNIAQFSESGRLSKYPLPGLTIHDNCTIRIDTNSSRYNYTDNSWGAVAITVVDYNTKPLTLGKSLSDPYVFYLSTSAVQFMVQVLERLDAPTFVSPTPPANHNFILYTGATWRQKVYAKPSANRTITEFTVLGREQETFALSGIHDGDDPNVKFVEVQWTPAVNETRNHIVCITAVDDTGVESDEDRCFSIGTKYNAFNSSTQSPKNAPYFNHFPAQGQLIECDLGATCAIPLYINSNAGIERIHISRTDFAMTKTGPVSEINKNGVRVYESDLLFRDTVPGLKTICVIAIDGQGKQSAEVCIMSNLIPPDPCSSNPCRNSALCSRSPENPFDYVCHCFYGFHGKTCGKSEDACNPNPCIEGRCYNIPPGTFYCACNKGFTGQRCSVGPGHCLPGSCHSHGVCENTTGGHTCKCYERYSGSDCSVDKCPYESPLPKKCDPCLLNPCSNGGTCSRSTENPNGYICHCQEHTHGERCEIGDLIHACKASPCITGVCYDTYPTFFCVCAGTGFSGTTCSKGHGHCLPGSCHSHGVCENGTANYHTCRCFSRYSGPDCQVDKCPQASPLENTCACDDYPCQNGGTCREDGNSTNKFVCKCPTGFSGTDCSIETPIRESHFDKQAAQPLEVECGLRTSCLVPVTYVGPDDKRPIVGYADADLQGVEMVTLYRNLSGYNTNETSTMEVLSFRYSAVGEHQFCLHTTDNGQTNGKVNDQLCLTVQVSAKGPNHTPINHARSVFSFSTPPSGTKLSCEKDIPCHLWVTTEPSPNGNCNSVVNCQSSVDDIRVAPPLKYSGTCITDVYTELTSDSGKLCLSAGQGGEHRTFEIVAAKSSGSIIDVSHSSVVMGRTKPYFVENPEVRRPIVCRKGSTCKVSIQVKSEARLSSIDITHYGQANATLGQPSWTGGFLYNVTLTVNLTSGGLHHICLVAKDTNNHTSDETCIQTELLYIDPCLPMPCLNSGTCVRDLKNPENYVCLCDKDLYSGRNCETVHSPCQPDPCMHGRCSVVNNYASCQCDAGYAGEQCDHKAFNCHVDKCIHGVCQNLVFSSHCVCDLGYGGQRCEAWNG